MPLVVNVGLNRKASRDYQSAGAFISLGAELDSGLIRNADPLRAEAVLIEAHAWPALDQAFASR